ncbi:MAG: dapF [Ilumatobacteraceae bacterium]|nr:dapF [Ilumatobacteraceae bacterium]
MITLTKHHGLGNDFLVCDTAQMGADAPWAELARQWCDRRRGVGADGLLLLTVIGDRELSMVLHNADGSRAEMSGNGIRCLAQAAFVAQQHVGPITYSIHTDAGLRTVDVQPVDSHTVQASVSMGAVSDLDEPSGWSAIGADPMRPVLHLSTGNPHTVVGVDDVRAVDLLTLGLKVPHINLEIIEPGPETSAITMRVHERGAGITEACGTGACVSAWAAVHWGLAHPKDGEILVHMDGGDATVRLHEPEPGHVTLVGPAVLIAHVQIAIPTTDHPSDHPTTNAPTAGQ